MIKLILAVTACLLPMFFVVESSAFKKPLHKFKAGEPARASEINENFQILKEEIEELSRQIEELKQAVRAGQPPKLEGSNVPQPSPPLNKFVPGTYKDHSTTCTLSTAPFGERTEGIFKCQGIYTLTVAWYTGALNGHPFETELKTAGIDKIPGYTNFAWGKVGSTNGVSWWNDCIPTNGVGGILSVRQTDKTLTFYSFGTDNKSKCQGTFDKTTP